MGSEVQAGIAGIPDNPTRVATHLTAIGVHYLIEINSRWD